MQWPSQGVLCRYQIHTDNVNALRKCPPTLMTSWYLSFNVFQHKLDFILSAPQFTFNQAGLEADLNFVLKICNMAN